MIIVVYLVLRRFIFRLFLICGVLLHKIGSQLNGLENHVPEYGTWVTVEGEKDRILDHSVLLLLLQLGQLIAIWKSLFESLLN